MNQRALLFAGCLWLLACVGAARPAEAQWYFAGYLGANKTRPADVEIAVPASALAITFDDVEFDGRPFESPQYYGWRLGKILGATRRFGIEAEFIHLKVIGLTGGAYSTTGTSGSFVLAPGDPMGKVVERFSMTHGLNFLVANLVLRQPLASGRAALIVRGGGGVTIPHTETTIVGDPPTDKYELGGAGVHVAAGIDFRLRGRLSFLAEYKFTHARPEITVTGGAARTRSSTHHAAAGLAFGISR